MARLYLFAEGQTETEIEQDRYSQRCYHFGRQQLSNVH